MTDAAQSEHAEFCPAPDGRCCCAPCNSCGALGPAGQPCVPCHTDTDTDTDTEAAMIEP